VAPHHLEVALDAIALRPGDLRRRRALDRKASREIADRNADAAEAAAESAVEVEKAEVQSGRNGDHHLDRVARSDHLQASAPEVFAPARVLFGSNPELDCVIEGRLAIAADLRRPHPWPNPKSALIPTTRFKPDSRKSCRTGIWKTAGSGGNTRRTAGRAP